MSILNAIPQVWAASILRALDTLLVYAQPGVVNRDYQGEITGSGDTVRITTLADVAISSYTRNTDIAAPEALTDAALTLAIDQQKYFNFALDDIDIRQSAVTGLLDEAARRAAYGLRKAVDTFMAEKYKDVDAANVVGSDSTPTHALKAEEAYKNLVELGTLLDETDTPEDSRFCVVPPFMIGAFEQDARFVSYGTQHNVENLMEGLAPSTNGLIGRVAGFNVYQSNQVQNTSSKKYKVIAGHPSAWSFADQLTETVAYRPERRFAEGLKGLHVYGGKVVRPSQLALLTTNNES